MTSNAATDLDVQARAAVAPGAWLEIRFEDITAQPRDAFASVLDFCGLPWDAEFERGYALHTFKSMRTDAYRRDLAPSDVALLTHTLERSLKAQGYDSSA